MDMFKAGIDIGSTTAKMVVLDENNKLSFSTYVRHNTDVKGTLISILEQLIHTHGDINLKLAITGTAGLGISERTNIGFVQEVIASSNAIRKMYPYCKTLIDIGGEDAKIIVFDEDFKADIRMNGNCAGGTGAFIDQMSTLLNIRPTDLSTLAKKATSIYPIASRCGVFAKTDVQTLVSRDVPKEDIAKSIFSAVAFQTINTLAKGFEIRPKILFTGGPFTFLPELKKMFLSVLNASEDDLYNVDHPELISAIGCALSDHDDQTMISVNELIELVSNIPQGKVIKNNNDKKALFDSKEEFNEWKRRHENHKVKSVSLKSVDGKNCFLGIDSGSTTTKIIITNDEGNVVLTHYRNNNGNPIEALSLGLKKIKKEIENVNINIISTAVTGYGEDLIKAAFKIDYGIVETMAHYGGAKYFDKNVSFILDIGGQDMKAIFIKDGIIENIEINEACSSGCGSFIETFARGMGYSVSDFANLACESENPCDLGSRCTVFMNSKVKQSLREGATIADIAAGLAMSVTLNCFTKVLKITDTSVLGDNIVVQGGTFKNASVLRSVEKFLGREVIRPDISELMGALGCSLIALDNYKKEVETLNNNFTSTFIGIDNIDIARDYERNQLVCKGCENICTVTKIKFRDDKSFFTGNKCEKIFSNKGSDENLVGLDMTKKKLSLLFDRTLATEHRNIKGTIGIPRVLNMYQNFPFWATLFIESGYNIVLSKPSSMAISDKGSGTVMSDNICFPAKIANGHIYDLIESNVDRIFYPSVVLEKQNNEEAANSYNCPVVTGYPDVIRSAINPFGKYGIAFDAPTISFLNKRLLYNGCKSYFVKLLGVDKKIFQKAFREAVAEQERVHNEVRKEACLIIEDSKNKNKPTILLVSRPYHVDPLISHKMSDIITSFGINVITEEAVSTNKSLSDIQVLTQWEYPNKMFNAVLWAVEQKDINLEVLQINSFGCGPDATTSDEIKAILNEVGKNLTLVKVDEITSPGSIKLRIRSLVESMKIKAKNYKRTVSKRRHTSIFKKGEKRIVLTPSFSEFQDPFIHTLISKKYNTITLPPPDEKSIEVGLRYANHDICYPATIIIGDIIKALKSGNYDTNNASVLVSQTCGQCRASSYASLLKRGLINAGFEHVPVVTFGLSVSNEQPGFSSNFIDLVKQVSVATPFLDAISSMYHYTAVREVDKGRAKEVANKYIALHPRNFGLKETNKLLKQAINEFNAINTDNIEYPKVGLVGEIYVKYNSFSNGFIVDWLMNKGIEVILSPMFYFFAQNVINSQINREANARNVSFISYHISKILEKVVNKRVDSINDIMSNFKGFKKAHYVRELAEKASQITGLTNQFGEGGLLPGEIATFASDDINNILCLQPFGCIANHIIARGIETRVKTLYPSLNLLYLDMDAGISEVNTVNRLEFFAKSAKEEIKTKNPLKDNILGNNIRVV